MSGAFEPPADEASSSSSSDLTSVMMAWMTSGAIVGLAFGLTAQVVGSELARPLPVLFLSAFSVAGLGAWVIERRFAETRPALMDAKGNLGRPPHVLLYALPLIAASPALLALILVGTVAMHSVLPAVVFGLGGFGLGWACRRLMSTHHLRSALQSLESGEVELAVQQLEALERGWVSTRRGRTSARLNLGMLALSRGDLDAASRWYAQVGPTEGAAFALAGTALVRVLQGRLEEAERVVMQALVLPGAEAIQNQLDAVRMLLTLRQEGTLAARELGMHLDHDEAGELFRGILALVHLREGAVAAARRVADDALMAALEDSGWRLVIPEIAELLVQPDLT